MGAAIGSLRWSVRDQMVLRMPLRSYIAKVTDKARVLSDQVLYFLRKKCREWYS